MTIEYVGDNMRTFHYVSTSQRIYDGRMLMLGKIILLQGFSLDGLKTTVTSLVGPIWFVYNICDPLCGW